MELENEEPFLFHSGSVGTLTEGDKLLHADEEPVTNPAFARIPVKGNPGRLVVAVTDDQIGVGDREHGTVLLHDFLEDLCDRANLPDEVVFYHRGVLLLEKGHPAESIIRQLCSLDLEIKVCIESLDFYNKEPAAHIMQPVPMSEITRDLLRADKVIRP